MENKIISITTRDINGKRYTSTCQNEAAAYRFLVGGGLCEEDEILVVTQGNICLFSALSCDHDLTTEDLIGFFA